MRRNTLILLVLLTISASTHGGWFSKDKSPEAERDRRIHTEGQLKDAQDQIEHQQKVITQLQWSVSILALGAVTLLIMGVALGSKVHRDGNKP